jgi:hypothetical protein
MQQCSSTEHRDAGRSKPVVALATNSMVSRYPAKCEAPRRTKSP